VKEPEEGAPPGDLRRRCQRRALPACLDERRKPAAGGIRTRIRRPRQSRGIISPATFQGLAHGGTGRRAHPLRAMHRQAAAFARGEVLTGEERESSHRDPIDLLVVDGSAAHVYLGPDRPAHSRRLASTSARRSSNHHPIHIAMVPYKSTPDEVEVELAMKTGGRWPAARSTLHVEARLLNRRRRRCHEVIEAQPDGAGAAHLSPAAAPTSMLKHGATRPALHVQAGAEDDGAITKTPREEATSSRCRRREDAEA